MYSNLAYKYKMKSARKFWILRQTALGSSDRSDDLAHKAQHNIMSAVVTAIRLQLALLWWKLCAQLLRLLYTQSIKPVGQYFHKVVVIGDDFAAGIGDYVTIGTPAGLAQYLAPLVKQTDKVCAFVSWRVEAMSSSNVYWRCA